MPVQVSVIMPVYNMVEFVGQAIDSILQQSFSDFELIVIDDASEDETDMVVQSYKDQLIIFERNNCNIGNYASRNRGMQLAQGKYIAVMDADDIAMPDRLEKQVSYLEKHSDVLAVGSGCISLPGGILREGLSSYRKIQLALLSNNCFVHSSLMIRKDILLKLNGYNERYYYSADYDLVCRLVAAGKVENLIEPLVGYRYHPFQISVLHKEKQQFFADEIRLKYQMNFINRYKKEDQSLVGRAEVSVSSIGQAIAYYTYALYSGDVRYKQEADELLDQVFSVLSAAIPARLDCGLLGITCGMIYMLRNNFIKGDEDEIFDEIDSLLFGELGVLVDREDFDWYGWLYYFRLRISRRCLFGKGAQKGIFSKNLEFLFDCLIGKIEKDWLPDNEVLFEIEQFHILNISKEKTAYILGVNGKE
ncbi:glycosyltransferase [Parabacteroides sp. AF17-28]|uniref:glycosyltransferase n=1 Tax=Parabacteroides sp. AF17-28 TaxID=2292241 RepID=UPI000EFF6DAC|nr:glycosyltransferase [Parabacteroides sp. AF17-28]RHR61826.1 glycosyltransferase [Parabacteroides sp. AF17-28]